MRKEMIEQTHSERVKALWAERESKRKQPLSVDAVESVLSEEVKTVEFKPFLRVNGYLNEVLSEDGLAIKFIITVSSIDSPGEQIKTIIHEIAHIYFSLAFHGEGLAMGPVLLRTETEEDFIEAKTEEFCNNNPDFVAQLLHRFKERSKLQK